jgi:hypothetical protein
VDRKSFRPSLAAACLGAPPVVVALTMLAMLAVTALGRRPLWPATPLTPSEAVTIGDDAAFARLVAAGADPNAPSSVGPGLREKRVRTLTPLQAAVIRGRVQQLQTVTMFGARVTGEAGRQAVCLAYEESPDLVPALLGRGAPAVVPESCRPRQP